MVLLLFANALAFVKHLQNVPFEDNNLKKVVSAHYQLSDIHDLCPFWENGVKSMLSREPSFRVTWLLMELHKEHETFIPQLLELYQSELKERETSMREDCTQNILVKEKEIRDNLMKLLQKKK